MNNKNLNNKIMKVAVKELIRDLQEQMDKLTSIEEEHVEVYLSSDDINDYLGKVQQVQYVSTHINVVEQGKIHIHTAFVTI
jgi:hypothetical protein